MSITNIAPNIKIIQESALASSDYFTLYERETKINLRESTLKPSKDEILGKVEFKMFLLFILLIKIKER